MTTRLMEPAPDRDARLEGLDVARFLALVGMVIVNFNVVMVTESADTAQFNAIAQMLQGRAAATFVVLAGIGLGLNAMRQNGDQALTTTLKRASFLLIVGILNLLIFDADIIHYYAFYFLFGVFFVRASNSILIFSIVGLVAGFVALVSLLDYDAGWNWQTYAYADFWTRDGFIRNLFFNGWHPLIPWLSFLLFGILLSRLDLASRSTTLRLFVGGSVVFAVVMIASKALINSVGDEAAILFSTTPIPPMPLYMIAGSSVACAVIGFCLLLEPQLRSYRLLHIFSTPGRQTLTLYIAHIVLGMGLLESLGMTGGEDARTSLIAAAFFIVIGMTCSLIWSRFFQRGPLEMLMRKIAA